MKRFPAFSLVLFAFIAFLCTGARSHRWIPPQPVSGGGAGTVKDSYAGTYNWQWTFGDSGGYTGASAKFTATASYTSTQATIRLKRNGTGGPGNVEVRIYADNAGVEGTLLATSGSVPCSSLDPSGAVQVFPNLVYSFTAPTAYHIAVFYTGTPDDGSNCPQVMYDDRIGHDFRGYYGSWMTALDDGSLRFQIYGN
jgi:hypothetical protein